jgi:glycosyltransferase involved in cell wall biosynthesis
MRIALLTNGLHPYVIGGMQRHSSMLSQHLVLRGAELVVFHTAYSRSEIQAARTLDGFPEPIKKEVEHVFVEYPKQGRFPGHYIRDSYQYSKNILYQWARCENAFDFIYAQGLTGRAFIEAKQRGYDLPPIGVNCHGYEMFQRAANLRNKLEHLLLRRTFARITQQADYVFSFSGRIREIIENRLSVDSNKIIQIPNAIDASWMRGKHKPSSKKRRFIFLGRYERRKGIKELHDALNEWDRVEIEFVFIGPIPQEKQLKLPWVHYRGSIVDSKVLQSELDQGDVLVCPSYAEGMPTVILEAMARSLAIIATDVGATRELVDNDNGHLISKLTTNTLKVAIKNMSSLSDQELDKMKATSLEKVSKYTWDIVSKDTLKSIAETIVGR